MSENHMDVREQSVIQELEDGQLSHDELCDRLGVHWDDLQTLIRSLRSKNKVAITLDRRYVSTDNDRGVDNE